MSETIRDAVIKLSVESDKKPVKVPGLDKVRSKANDTGKELDKVADKTDKLRKVALAAGKKGATSFNKFGSASSRLLVSLRLLSNKSGLTELSEQIEATQEYGQIITVLTGTIIKVGNAIHAMSAAHAASTTATTAQTTATAGEAVAATAATGAETELAAANTAVADTAEAATVAETGLSIATGNLVGVIGGVVVLLATAGFATFKYFTKVKKQSPSVIKAINEITAAFSRMLAAVDAQSASYQRLVDIRQKLATLKTGGFDLKEQTQAINDKRLAVRQAAILAGANNTALIAASGTNTRTGALAFASSRKGQALLNASPANKKAKQFSAEQLGTVQNIVSAFRTTAKLQENSRDAALAIADANQRQVDINKDKIQQAQREVELAKSKLAADKEALLTSKQQFLTVKQRFGALSAIDKLTAIRIAKKSAAQRTQAENEFLASKVGGTEATRLRNIGREKAADKGGFGAIDASLHLSRDKQQRDAKIQADIATQQGTIASQTALSAKFTSLNTKLNANIKAQLEQAKKMEEALITTTRTLTRFNDRLDEMKKLNQQTTEP